MWVKLDGPITNCLITNYSITWVSESLWSDESDGDEEYSSSFSDKGYPIYDLQPYSKVTVEVAVANTIDFGNPTSCWAVTDEERKY